MFQKIKENLKLSFSENCYNKSYFWTKKKPWIHCLECPDKHISFFSPEFINFYIGCPLFSLGGSGSSFSKRRICSEYSPQVLVLREGRFDPQRKRMKNLQDKDKIKAKSKHRKIENFCFACWRVYNTWYLPPAKRHGWLSLTVFLQQINSLMILFFSG